MRMFPTRPKSCASLAHSSMTAILVCRTVERDPNWTAKLVSLFFLYTPPPTPSLFFEPSANQLSPSPGRCARPTFQSSMLDKLTLYFLSERYRGDVLSFTIFMIRLLTMLAVVPSFLKITVLVFSPILQAALPASA